MQAMKVPFTANNVNGSQLPINTYKNPATGSPYEPKSVLENCGSPSSIADQKPVSNTASDKILISGCEQNLQLGEEDHERFSQNLEDWDSLMRDLGLNDDSIKTQNSNLPAFSAVSSFDSIQFVPTDFGILQDIQTDNTAPLNLWAGDLNSCNWDTGSESHVDDLIRLAECFETNSFQLGHVILARLNQSLTSPVGKPLQRAAFYFKEALQSLLTGSNPMARPASSSEIIQTIKAHKTFSSISPISMFLSFTANQALLDALDGSKNLHAIDFEIGLGDHWASFMKELACKADSYQDAPPVLRISALIPEEYTVYSRLIRDNLTQFARELNIKFDIDFVLIRTFEYLSFNSIKFMDCEKIAVLLSPSILRRVGSGFVNDLRQISPLVVVHVDTEGQMGFGSTSYRQILIHGLEFYSTVLESLEAAKFNSSGDWMRRIETFVLFRKIVEGMEAAACSRCVTPVREALVAAGLRPVGLSQFAEFQADWLLRRAQVGGFQVIKRQGEMVLCWHDRPLVATSSWRN
ncbi:scarecrow-like protein 15 [Primulina huaijiensis]|uniref:scarecrow-like protein 15 n=1 Tax=Primulina huaijiensis TaxID=1492673 RepID=UPI003CC6F1C8